MIKHLLLLSIFIFTLSCIKTSSTRQCKDFKNGTFKFTYALNGIEHVGIFKRFDNLSIDYFHNTVDSSSVRWINDCEFVLKKINPKTVQEKDPIHIRIIETNDSAYVFEFKLAVSKMNTPTVIKKGVAVKIDM